MRGGVTRGRRSGTWRMIPVVAALAAACNGPILANPPQSFPSPAVAPRASASPADPIRLAFPRDDGPHARLTEWWYYTGHLRTLEGRRFGFEAVVFRAERSSIPTGWVSHLALTDEQNGTFHYAQRSEVGPQVDRSPRVDGEPTGFDLQVSGLSPALVAAGAPASATPWRLWGGGGHDRIEAALAAEEGAAAGATFRLSLNLEAVREPIPHDEDGFVDFSPAGTSYYYSRTRMNARGSVLLDGEFLPVDGIAWFDHQWGDFVSVGGGWDWFAVNLSDGTDLTLSIVRNAAGTPVLSYGTLVQPGELPDRLDETDFVVEAVDSWTSPRTGRTWPSGWHVTAGDYAIELEPTVKDQEVDGRATSGVAYWEGSQVVRVTKNGQRIDGEAYVEITRYAD